MDTANTPTRICTACKLEKYVDEFPPDKRAKKDGRQARCRKCINEWIKMHYRSKPAEHMIRRARARATRKGLEFDLEASDVLPLPEVCPVFGVKLRIGAGDQDPHAYSLDWRIRRRADEFTYGWTLTCHKSQGSQYDNPLVFDESRSFREDARKWLYTAVTRAAERITVVQ